MMLDGCSCLSSNMNTKNQKPKSKSFYNHLSSNSAFNNLGIQSIRLNYNEIISNFFKIYSHEKN